MKPHHPEDFDWQAQTGAKPFRLRPQNPRLAIWMGYLVSQLVGWGAMALAVFLARALFPRMGDVVSGFFVLSQFLLIPFGMGVVASYFWQDEKSIKKPDWMIQTEIRGSALVNTLIGCCGALWVFRANLIGLFLIGPLFLIWPLLWALMAAGMRVGASFWRKNPF